MIHLRISLVNGDVFECDHTAKTFREAVDNVLSQPYLYFTNTVVNVSHIVALENIVEDDTVKGLSVQTGSRNKGGLS